MGEFSQREKQLDRIRRCHGKIAYPTVYVDKAIKNLLLRQGQMYKYPCGTCLYWHLTSKECYGYNFHQDLINRLK
jgi:hypothetical protein